MSDLRKATGGILGTFMALSTILGSGMMILPGTSYHELGSSAWMPWAVAAASVIPLLYCYAWLGRHHPSASGVAHYAQAALGPTVGRAAGLLAAGALLTGIPATAITGGRYVAAFSGAGYVAWLFPLVVLIGATLVAAIGANVSAKLQVGLILALFALVVCMTMMALGHEGVAAPSAALPPFAAFGGVLTAVYVAFTGWETVAFTFEEHKRPDLIPRIFAASYVIVIVLYGLLLFGLFATAAPGDPALDQAPLLIIAESAFGGLGRPITLLLVVATITANVVASVLALSRLVFGMARGGHLPRRLSRMRERDGNPVISVFAVGTVLTLIALLQWTGLVPFTWLFILSGGIYFVLYGVGAASYGRLAAGGGARVVTVLCAVTVVAVTIIAGPPMWLCWAVSAVVWLGVLVASRRPAALVRVRESVR